jgi:hypothetical protein
VDCRPETWPLSFVSMSSTQQAESKVAVALVFLSTNEQVARHHRDAQKCTGLRCSQGSRHVRREVTPRRVPRGRTSKEAGGCANRSAPLRSPSSFVEANPSDSGDTPLVRAARPQFHPGRATRNHGHWPPDLCSQLRSYNQSVCRRVLQSSI